MPRDGSGNYTLPAGNPVVGGTDILASVQNNTTSDIASALTASIAKDGQTAPTANLPMGGFKHTNVGSATLGSQYLTATQAQNQAVAWGGTSGGSANAQTIAPAISPAAYAAGQRWQFIAGFTNTGAATLSVSGLAVRNIKRGASLALIGGEIVTGEIVTVTDNGTDLLLDSDAEQRPVQFGVLAEAKNLVITRPSASTVTFTADQIMLRTAGGLAVVIPSWSVTLNITTSGAGGLDTGAEAANTWYYVWAAYNGTTKSGVLSASSTSPTLPGGYTLSGLLGAVRNDGSSNFIEFHQRDGFASNDRVATLTKDLNGGTATTLTSFTVTVPSIARWAQILCSSAAGVFYIANDTGANRYETFKLYPLTGGTGGGQSPTLRVPIRTGSTLYYKIAGGGDLNVYAEGWEF